MTCEYTDRSHLPHSIHTHTRTHTHTHAHTHTHTHTHTHIHTGLLTICISDECIGGLGGSGDNFQFGGFMCLSNELTVIIERLSFIGSGEGSSSTYVNRLCMLKMNIIIQQIKLKRINSISVANNV